MTRDKLTPKAKAYLIGASVGLVIFGVLAAVPFVPWPVAGAAGVFIALVAVLFLRSLFDPTFLDGSQHTHAWRDEDWDAVSADDDRGLEALAPDDIAKVRKSVAFGDITVAGLKAFAARGHRGGRR